MGRSISWLLINARVLLALVFLLNGFGIINQAIPDYLSYLHYA